MQILAFSIYEKSRTPQLELYRLCDKTNKTHTTHYSTLPLFWLKTIQEVPFSWECSKENSPPGACGGRRGRSRSSCRAAPLAKGRTSFYSALWPATAISHTRTPDAELSHLLMSLRLRLDIISREYIMRPRLSHVMRASWDKKISTFLRQYAKQNN